MPFPSMWGRGAPVGDNSDYEVSAFWNQTAPPYLENCRTCVFNNSVESLWKRNCHDKTTVRSRRAYNSLHHSVASHFDNYATPVRGCLLPSSFALDFALLA